MRMRAQPALDRFHQRIFLLSRLSLLRVLPGVLGLAIIGSPAIAQGKVSHPPKHSQRTHTSRKTKEIAAKSEPAPPKTPSEIAASPAQVRLERDDLTVNANNSELSAILADVSHQSGMEVDGNAGHARVFGQYGPGNPRQVLTELLADTGVNFVMVGDTHTGAPRQLVLMAQSGATTPTSSAAAGSPTGSTAGPQSERPGMSSGGPENPAQTESNQTQGNQDQNDQGQGYQEPLGPGAVPNQPPQPSPDAQTRVQQNLQRLQQMHQQLEQQQNAPE